MTTRIAAVVLSAGLLSAAGCGSPVADVSGTVTVGGKPISTGKVAFLCEGGTKPVLTADIKDGRYAVSGVPGGRVTVTVAGGGYRFDPVPGMPKGLGAAGAAGDGPAAVPAAAGKNPPVAVPPRYGDPAQSGLSFTVERNGALEHNLDLQP